jgi:Xaa-Pro aminopeptidase
MLLAFHLWGVEPPRCITVNESDDGSAVFAKAARSLGPIRRLGVGSRTWGETMIEIGRALPGAELVNGTPLVNRLRRIKSPLELELMTAACKIADETMAAVTPLVQPGVSMAELAEAVEHEMRMRGSRSPSFPTHLFSFGYPESHDSQTPSGLQPIAEGEAVMFDFGAVHASGYSSDFGRTIVCGEPPEHYADAYAAMLAGQEAGRAAAVPGALCSEVNAACRGPIEEAGYGPYFRHRMGHGIGLDVHEQPYISVEDSTPLEPGMTFTDEPSILWNDHFAVRCEDVVVCAEGGGRVLNDYPTGSVVNPIASKES